jgi:hypothetical protein
MKINSPTKKKKPSKASLSEKHLLARNIIKDIIEHSIRIAYFNFNHKKYQKIFENRSIKKEVNFLTHDSYFSGKIFPSDDESHKWTFISRAIGKIITIEENGEIKLYDFNTKQHKIYKLPKKENLKIICSEIDENDQNADSRLLFLFQDLTFYTINLLILNSKEYDNNDMESIIGIIGSEPFDFKPYLNINECNSYIPNYENIKKIIIFLCYFIK